jgi:nucleoside-diphosphate-sugar epimerase
MDNHVLITGGYGFVGNNLWENLSKNVDIISKYKFFRFHSKQYDLNNVQSCHKLFQYYKPNYIIHLAAKCGGIGANQLAPATFWTQNLVMAANLLEFSALHNVKKFITLGTVCSYGRNATPPFKEDQLYSEWPEITNRPYGVAKLAIYEGCRAFESQFGLPFTYLIPTNMYGKYDYFGTQTSHVIPAMMVKMIQAVENKRDTVELWGDGTPTRDFLYAPDCADAIMAALDIDTGTQPINLGTGKEYSMLAISEMMAQVTGFKGQIIWNKDKPNGQPRRAINFDRAKETLAWEPKTDLYNGIKMTYDWAMAPAKKKAANQEDIIIDENDEEIT